MIGIVYTNKGKLEHRKWNKIKTLGICQPNKDNNHMIC